LLGSLVVVWFSLRATFIATAITFFIAAIGASLLLPKIEAKTAIAEV
jgi:hypothetical protein